MSIKTEDEIKVYWNAFEEIREIDGSLYYHAIKDPVKRADAIYSIIEKANEVLGNESK